MKYDIVIIGSGVAGLTAGLYTARAGKSVMIIEEGDIGGIVTTLDNIENYPGFDSINGFDLIQKIYMQVLNIGVNFEFNQINNIDFDSKIILLDNGKIEYKALIIATGSSYKRLNVDGEKQFLHKGISYCAICDGNLYKNQDIVLITNGEIGSNAYHYLSNLTSNLKVLNLSNNVSFAKNVVNNVKISKFIGNDKLNSIEYIVDNKLNTLNCNAVFISLGRETNLSLFKDKIQINDKYILSDENMHTNLSGVFVAGDVRQKSLRQIITACSDGAIAGTEAVKYLNIN